MPHVPRNKCFYPNASEVVFVPLTSSDWVSNPGTVQMALDELGARSTGGSGGGSSGYSGYSGFSGYSGYSGYSGSGISGYSGFSGISGYSGSGISGYSGFSGISGYSGMSGYTGTYAIFMNRSFI